MKRTLRAAGALLSAFVLAPSVLAQTGPNLTVSTLVTPGNGGFLRRLESLAYSCTIVNTGTTRSGPTTGALYLSTDLSFDPGDFVLRRFAIPPLDPGQSHVQQETFALPGDMPRIFAVAPCELGAIADVPDKVSETSEVDNDQYTQRACVPTFDGAPGDELGHVVARAGDVNGDGFGDVILGAPLADAGASDAGEIRVISGANGATLFTANGDNAGDQFGFAVAPAGDLNADGFADFFVSAPYGDTANGTDSGYVRTIYGPNGAQTVTANGVFANQLLGYRLANVGDLNDDGYDDVALAGPLENPGGVSGAGVVRAFSGRDGTGLWSFPGTIVDERLGHAVAAAGDVNGDGVPDVIVGSPFADLPSGSGAGRARVLSGVDGTEIYTLDGTSMAGFFGSAVAGLDDLDGDGRAEFAIGASGENGGSLREGAVRVYRGSDATVLYTFLGNTVFELLGEAVANAGDVDGDGTGDILTGARGADSFTGRVSVYSGSNGRLLRSYDGDAIGLQFGSSVAGAGDINSDGFADIVAGASDPSGSGLPGYARILFTQPAELYEATVNGQFAVGERLGTSVAFLGDVDGDGFADVGAGSQSGTRGRLQGFSGADQTGIPVLSGTMLIDDRFATTSLTGIADLDADGLDEVAAGMPGRSSATGALVVWNDANGWFLVRNGDNPGDDFGYSVADAGDYNGDGVHDVIVGAPQLTSGGPGYALVISGEWISATRTGQSPLTSRDLYRFNGVDAGSAWGWSVGGGGDFNNDGLDDVIIGAPFFDRVNPNDGRITIRAGGSGANLHTVTFGGAGANTGWSVGFLPDLNGDGGDDPWIASPGRDDDGVVVVLDSSNPASAVLSVRGESAGGRFGNAVTGAGDIDADGLEDIAISSLGVEDARLGPVGGSSPFPYEHLVPPGSQISRVEVGVRDWGNDRWTIRLRFFYADAGGGPGGQSPWIGFGDQHTVSTFTVPQGHVLSRIEVRTAPNNALSGSPDVLRGVTLTTDQGFSRSYGSPTGTTVQLLGDGREIRGVFGTEGLVVDSLGIILPANDSASVSIYSGANRELLQRLDGSRADGFGTAIAGGGDFDCDGRPDLIVTAPDARDAGGQLHWFANRAKPSTGRAFSYGAGCPASTGRLPRIGVEGLPLLGSPFNVTLRAAPTNAPTTLFLAFGRAVPPVPLDLFGWVGCNVLVDLATVVAVPSLTDANGRAAIPLDIAPGTVVPPVYAQWIALELLNVVVSDATNVVIEDR